MSLDCPNCKVDLVITHRQGVEIDYCPKCRGVWLDRGELDKILDRAEGQPETPLASTSAVNASLFGGARASPPQRRDNNQAYKPHRDGRRDDDDDDDDDDRRRNTSGRRKSWLADFFD